MRHTLWVIDRPYQPFTFVRSVQRTMSQHQLVLLVLRSREEQVLLHHGGGISRVRDLVHENVQLNEMEPQPS